MFDHVLRRKMKEYFCRGTTGEWVETEIDTSKIVMEMLKWKEEREKFLADALTSSTTVFPTSCSDEKKLEQQPVGDADTYSRKS